MENKKSFLIYNDLKLTLDKIPNELAGELFKMILDFANGLDPKTNHLAIDIAFSNIKSQMIRDAESWTVKAKERSRSGRLGNLKKYHTDLYDRVKLDEITLEEAEGIVESRKTSHSDK